MFAIFDAPATALRAAFEFRLGRVHGMFCLGCCWALMLVGFAASMANLWWMPRSPR